MRSLTRLLLAVSLTVTALPFLGSGSATGAPATPWFGPAIDGYAPSQPQTTCDPTAKPGVVDLRDLFNATYGGHTSYIARACDDGETSEHKEGRALDYMLDVNNPTENGIANDIINWLLATDQYGNRHAMLRRLGIIYIIRNRQIWHTSTKSWQPYSGPSPHTDHIHLTFSWAGARRQTTWWTGRAVPVNGLASADVTGDGYADMLGRAANGDLFLYVNRHNASWPFPDSPIRVGSDWQQFSWFLAGNVTNDNLADVVAARPDGTLRLYTNTGNPSWPFDDGRDIGNAWNQFSHITLGDVNGDGRAELIAARPDGTLHLYLNVGPNTWPFDNGHGIGTQWNQFKHILAGRVTTDGLADIIANRPDGILLLYRNQNNISWPFDPNFPVGEGWQPFNRIMLTDLTGDGLSDIVATQPDGGLYLYPNRTHNTVPYTTGYNIGTGWGMYG